MNRREEFIQLLQQATPDHKRALYQRMDYRLFVRKNFLRLLLLCLIGIVGFIGPILITITR